MAEEVCAACKVLSKADTPESIGTALTNVIMKAEEWAVGVLAFDAAGDLGSVVGECEMMVTAILILTKSEGDAPRMVNMKKVAARYVLGVYNITLTKLVIA